MLPQTEARPRAQQPDRSSTRPIRALSRGLRVLTELNRLHRASIHAIASAASLPRTTTYRILETLRGAGYVQRDRHDDHYAATARVQSLSAGFDEEAKLAYLARPQLSILAEGCGWPIALAVPMAASLVVRESTASTGEFETFPPGTKLSVSSSAAGLAFLAASEANVRSAVLSLLTRSQEPGERAPLDQDELQRVIAETQARGYAAVRATRRGVEEASIAVAVRSEDRVLASLMMRFLPQSSGADLLIERCVGRLQEAALTLASGSR